MLGFIPGFHSRGIGLDIQNHEIRLVQVRQRYRRMIFDKTQVIPLAPDTIVDGKIKRFDQMQMALLELTQQKKLRKSTIAIGLPVNCTISKRLQFPSHLTPLELEVELMSHLTHYFPGIKELLLYDYTKLNSNDPQYDYVYVVAARSEQVMNYVHVVQSVGLKVGVVDIDLYALIRAVRLIENIQQSSFILFAIQETDAQFIVIHQEELIFYQSFLAGHSYDLRVQLKQAWSLYQGTHSEQNIASVFLLSEQTRDKQWIEQELLMTRHVIHSLQGFNEISYKLLAALGLAMRALRK